MNSMRTRRKGSIKEVVIFVALVAFSVVYLFPVLWMILTAFRTEVDLEINETSFIPNPWALEGFHTMFESAPVGTWLKNSIAMTVIITFSVLLTSTLLGYVFARFEFRGKNLIFTILLATMMLPGQVTMIPRFIMILRMGLYNTLWAVIIPNLVRIYNIYLCRSAIESLPRSLFDAAQLDGAGPWRIYWNVVLPNIKPAIGVTGIFTAMGAWNNYRDPLIYLNDPEKMTLPLALTWFSTQRGSNTAATMAAALIIMAPMIVVFFLFQKQFMNRNDMSNRGQ